MNGPFGHCEWQCIETSEVMVLALACLNLCSWQTGKLAAAYEGRGQKISPVFFYLLLHTTPTTTIMTPIQAQTPPHKSTGTDFNLRLAVSFFRHFAFLYNTYVARSGWSVSTVDEVANRAIRKGIQHLVRDGHRATLDHVTFLATQNLCGALPGMAVPSESLPRSRMLIHRTQASSRPASKSHRLGMASTSRSTSMARPAAMMFKSSRAWSSQ